MQGMYKNGENKKSILEGGGERPEAVTCGIQLGRVWTNGCSLSQEGCPGALQLRGSQSLSTNVS